MIRPVLYLGIADGVVTREKQKRETIRSDVRINKRNPDLCIELDR